MMTNLPTVALIALHWQPTTKTWLLVAQRLGEDGAIEWQGSRVVDTNLAVDAAALDALADAIADRMTALLW